MLVRAKVSFAGQVSMAKNEVRDVPEDIAAPLLSKAAQMPQYAQGRVHIPKLGHVHQLAFQRADYRGGDNGERSVL